MKRLALPSWIRSAAADRALGRRQLRLASGLVVGLFALMHFSNVGLGLVSIQAMEAGHPWLTGPWRSLPGTVLLAGAFTTHFALTLSALYARRTLRLTVREAAQLALGLLVPFLLARHIVATRVEPALTQHPVGFPEEVFNLWVASPAKGIQQAVLLLVVWIHGCFGIWFWLRSKDWFPRYSSLFACGAVIVPMIALLGFAEAGKQVSAPAFPHPVPRTEVSAATLQAVLYAIYLVFASSIGAVLVARGLRSWGGRKRRVAIQYPGGRIVRVQPGFSVLEASRSAQIPHLSVCGGRGRCSTCRVRVTRGLHLLPTPDAAERATLARVKARPDVRLACQLRPTHDVGVFPVLAVARSRQSGDPGGARTSASHERELAVLFCDLRGFTRRAEQLLPFDTVFLLNRYFEVIGEAVERAGGHLDKFIGDGALALFGLSVPAEIACAQALDAAAAISRGIETINLQYQGELDEPLRIAMGVHAGTAVVGEMGYGQATSLTAVGDGINVASRLEGAAKEFGVEAVVSAEVLVRAGRAVPGCREQAVEVRGRVAPVAAVIVPRASDLLGSGRGTTDRSSPALSPGGGARALPAG